MKPMSMEVFDVEPSAEPEQAPAELKVDGRTLENACYRVVIARNGDIESIFDKRLGRQLLTAPARLEFLHESPRQWPAWNMDWKDRRQAPVAFMDENAAVRIVERGPVRATLEVSRQGRDSRIVQRISLAAGEAGRRIEVDNRYRLAVVGRKPESRLPAGGGEPRSLLLAQHGRGRTRQQRLAEIRGSLARMVRPDRPQRPFRRLSARRLPLRFGQARRQYAASDAHVYARSQRSALHLPGDAGLRHPRRQTRTT